MKFRITMTAANRPQYLRRVLASWNRASGHNSIPWIFRVEPMDADVLKLVKDFKVTKKVHVNDQVQGALKNPYLALDDGFKDDADFVILGEDDSIVAPDIIEYFVRMAHMYWDEPNIFAVCAFTHTPVSEDEEATFLQPYFASCVWGTWQDRWEKYMRYNWDHDYTSGGWDHRFVGIIQGSGFECVFPAISRVQHIGQYDGVHMNPEDFESLQAQRFLSKPKSNQTKFKGVTA